MTKASRPSGNPLQFSGCNVLVEMLSSGQVELPNGKTIKLKANISSRHCDALYNFLIDEPVASAIEIGMAYGVSTLTILSALSNNNGRLVSIDPYTNWDTGRVAALFNIEKAGYIFRHRHMREMSFVALPELLSQGDKFEFAYVDGSHEYEDVFVDFFYIDKLLRKNGVVAFDDVGRRAVFEVVRLIQRRCDYHEVDVGLNNSFLGRTILHTLGRRILNRPRQNRYFRKTG